MRKRLRGIKFRVSESSVEECVDSHFKDLGFLTKRQHTIQIGSRTGRPDVVVYTSAITGFDINQATRGIILIIVECKAEGIVNHGKPQLNSYLSATDTRLGVFANSLKPEKWQYYENHRRNRIRQISRNEFLSILQNERKQQESIQQRIIIYTEFLIDNEARKLVTETRIQERLLSIIENESKRRIHEEDFRSAIEMNLKTALDNSKKQIASLNAEISDKNGCLGWCIAALVGLVLILVLSSG